MIIKNPIVVGGNFNTTNALLDRLENAVGVYETFTITNNLTNCTSDNSANTIVKLSSYSATIMASSGYTLTGATISITMGGVDITSSAYSNGVISIASVTGNLVITISAALGIMRTFGDNNWTTIAQVSQTIASQNMSTADIYTNYGWSVGDTKDITLSNNEEIQVRIIGFNHDTLSSDHSSKAGITLQMVNCLATRYGMNSSDTNAGGWNASVMRTSTLPTIKALLPSDLQSVIKLVDKKAANGGSSNYSATVTSSDDLFLLAEIEIFGSVSYAQDGSNEGTQYAYWASHNQASDRIKYYDNAGSQTATDWWERSSRSGNTGRFCYVNYYGGASSNYASYTRGVSFALCI